MPLYKSDAKLHSSHDFEFNIKLFQQLDLTTYWFFLLASACGQDTDLHISEQVFEAEFNKLYATKEDEAKAAEALVAAEQEVNYFESKSQFCNLQ